MRKIRFEEDLSRISRLAYGGFYLKENIERITYRRKRQAFMMIKMRSMMNLQMLQQNMGITLLNSFFSKNKRSYLIYAFMSLKVMFEYKNELDNDIKMSSKMTTLRSNVNNKLLNTNRVRRRFIRHKQDFIFKNEGENQNGGAVEGSMRFTGDKKMALKTSGINNFIVGDKAVTRVRDKQYYDDESESYDGGYDSQIAYPVMRQGIDGEEKMILHSNQILSERSVTHSMNNSMVMDRSFNGRGSRRNLNASAMGGSSSRSSIWDIKEQRLGGKSRVNKIENGIFIPQKHSMLSKMELDVSVGGLDRSFQRKERVKNIGRGLLTRKRAAGRHGDVRHQNYRNKHGDNIWQHGT